METVTVESISVGVPFLCSCGQGRITKIESAKSDYKMWCQCGARYYVTATGRVFKSGGAK